MKNCIDLYTLTSGFEEVNAHSLSLVYFGSGEVYSDFLFLMWAFPLSKACFQIADILLKYQQFEESNVRL